MSAEHVRPAEGLQPDQKVISLALPRHLHLVLFHLLCLLSACVPGREARKPLAAEGQVLGVRERHFSVTSVQSEPYTARTAGCLLSREVRTAGHKLAGLHASSIILFVWWFLLYFFLSALLAYIIMLYTSWINAKLTTQRWRNRFTSHIVPFFLCTSSLPSCFSMLLIEVCLEVAISCLIKEGNCSFIKWHL